MSERANGGAALIDTAEMYQSGRSEQVLGEPWTAPANALNSGERLLRIAAGGERALELAIRV